MNLQLEMQCKTCQRVWWASLAPWPKLCTACLTPDPEATGKTKGRTN